MDMDEVIKELTNLPTTIYCGLYQLRITHDLRNKVIALLKEQEHKDKMFHALEEDWKRLKALLKEQEPVKPIPPTDESEMWRCGNCHHQIFRCTHQRFCERCGHEVKWE